MTGWRRRRRQGPKSVLPVRGEVAPPGGCATSDRLRHHVKVQFGAPGNGAKQHAGAGPPLESPYCGYLLWAEAETRCGGGAEADARLRLPNSVIGTAAHPVLEKQNGGGVHWQCHTRGARRQCTETCGVSVEWAAAGQGGRLWVRAVRRRWGQVGMMPR